MSAKDARLALGERLRFEREATGMTREELADQLGCPPELVKRWELGRTRIPAERLCAIAQALGITVARLLAPPRAAAVKRAA